MDDTPTKEDLEELRADGYTREEIADHYGVSLSQVKRWITELKVEKKLYTKGGRRRRSKANVGIPLPEDYGLTIMEKAQRILGARLTYQKAIGYKLDGRLATVSQVLSAAGVSAD